jgi:septal ring factor EnvC (AmiA/AmiB activator)
MDIYKRVRVNPPPENEELVKKAEGLGINVDEFDDDDSLQEEINNKSNDDSDDSVDSLKKKLAFQTEEAKKAFKDRDSVKSERRKLQAQLNEVKKSLEEAPDKEELKT